MGGHGRQGHSLSKGGPHLFRSKRFICSGRREHGNCRVWIQASSKGQAKEALDFVSYQHRLLAGLVHPEV